MKIALDKKLCKVFPHLYYQRHQDMQRTCMCWGFECGNGWYEPLYELSRNLEKKNREIFAKYRLRIEAAQVKEKYGTLRFYFDIHRYGTPLNYMYGSFLLKCADLMHRIFRFKLRYVVDAKAYEQYEWVERSLDTIKAWNKEFDENSYDVKRYKFEDGKWYEYTKIYHPGKGHNEPVRFAKLYDWYTRLQRYGNLRLRDNDIEYPETLMDEIYAFANDEVNHAEQECAKRCEECGAMLTDTSAAVTRGWIKYVCESCASKMEVEYTKRDKKTYYKGTLVKNAKKRTSTKKE